MHADLESGTDVVQHVFYDLSFVTKVDGEAEIARAAKAGSLLAMSTSSDGLLEYRVFVDEELPEALRPRISTTQKDVLLRVPSGTLIAAGMERAGVPANAESTMELPAGNYLVDVSELDYDWDRDIVPVLRAELGGGYRRELIGGLVGAGLTLLGIGGLVTGGLAWSLPIMILAAVILVFGLVTRRVVPGAAYKARKTEISRRFPGLVLVLRRLDNGVELSAHSGTPISFAD